LTVDACVNTVPVAISKTASHVYPGNYDNVFRAVCDTAQAEAMTASVADPGSGFVDWGKNSTNVERVFRRLSERLGRWTENVSDGGRPGVDSL
jgi:hypothetical protein